MHNPLQSNNFMQFEFCPEPASHVGAVDDVDVVSDTDEDEVAEMNEKLWNREAANPREACLRPVLHQANIKLSIHDCKLECTKPLNFRPQAAIPECELHAHACFCVCIACIAVVHQLSGIAKNARKTTATGGSVNVRIKSVPHFC